MAVELSTSEKQINYSEWNANGQGYYLATCQYVKYAKINGSTARIYVRQCVKGLGGSWSGSNSHYRSRGYNWEWDSGYGQWGSCGTDWKELWSGSFDVSDSNNHGIVCYGSTYGDTYNNGGPSTEVYVPSSAFDSPPTGLSVSNIVRNKDGFTATVSITGWGRGGSASDRYRELQVWTNSSSGLIEPRKYQPQKGSELSGTITVNNSSASSLTIVPNTMYVIGAYASNGAANTGSIRIGQNTTLADELDAKSAEVIDIHSIKINYTTKADGGKYAKKIQYSLDNSTWVDGATVSTGSATSGSFNITGLKAGTQYTVYLRISTDSGITTSGSVTAKTKTACKIIRGDSVIEAIPYVIKPDGTKIELNVRRV